MANRSSSWINLLSNNGGSLVVRDNTPAKETIKCPTLLRDKRRLTQDALQSRERIAQLESDIACLRIALTDSHNQNAEVCTVLEEQSKLISELRESSGVSDARDTITSLQQGITERDELLAGVYSLVQELRNEVNRLTQTVGPANNSLLNDLERLTHHNTDLSESLSATQHSRSLLERELISLQTRLVEQKSKIVSLERNVCEQSNTIITLNSELSEANGCLNEREGELINLKTSQLVTINDKCAQVEQLKNLIESQLISEQEVNASEKRALEIQVRSLQCQIKTLYGQVDAKDKLIRGLQEHGFVLNGSMGSEISICSSTSSLRRHTNKLSKAQTEVNHLKQRLSDSRATSLSLEVECAKLQTEAARLSGSQQALLTIKQQLLEQNTTLDNKTKSFKHQWEVERITWTSQINNLHNQLNKTRELVSSRENENMKCVAMETELNISKHEIFGLRTELSHVTLDLDHVITMCHVTGEYMQSTINDSSLSVLILKEEYHLVKDDIQVASSVNEIRQQQIEVVDKSVSGLCSELEILRARKKVALSMLRGDGVVDKWRAKLKREKQQTNFVRLRLGYVIGELRLYKQLKMALEERLSNTEQCLENVQSQHLLCVHKLQQTELN